MFILCLHLPGRMQIGSASAASKGEVRPLANKNVGPEDKIDERDESFAAETREPSAKS